MRVLRTWTDRRDDADEEIWVGRICTEPAHWSERGDTPSPPPTTVTVNSDGTVDIDWTKPNIFGPDGSRQWGDGGLDPDNRHYQLLHNGSVHPAYTTIPRSQTLISSFDPGNCISHSYQLRAVNSCGVEKDYGETTISAKPATVAEVMATDLDECAISGVSLSWDAVAGAYEYNLAFDGAVLSYAITSPHTYLPGDDDLHDYRVRGRNDACIGSWSPGTQIADEDLRPHSVSPSVSDPDECQQSGIEISWSAVANATGYDLRVDGSTVVSDVTSPYTYSPGDSAVHCYEVRAKNATCGPSAWSTAATLADDDATPVAAPPTIVDVQACQLSGIRISWQPVSGATRYDLRVDGLTVIADLSSPFIYQPGDYAAHSYEIRAGDATCGDGPWSTPVTFSDGTPPELIILCDSFESGDTSAWHVH